MPRRDPKTGKFVSGGEVADWNDLQVVTGSLTSVIPAADLSGSKNEDKVVGEDAEIVDFSPVLGRNEVFEAVHMTAEVNLSMPRTATAESSGELEWAIATDYDREEATLSGGHYAGVVHRSAGIVDVNQHQTDETSYLAIGRLAATNSFADSATGLGGGSDWDRERVELPFLERFGVGPRFDEDDEIASPHTLAYDGISDHAIAGSIDLMMYGVIEES